MREKLYQGLGRVYLKLMRPLGRELRAWGFAQQAAVQSPDLVAPPAERTLVIAPHPDDESIGCAGTILKMARRTEQVDYVLVTGGDYGPEPNAASAYACRRAQELRGCLEFLGLTQIFYLAGHDGRLAEQPELAGELRALLARRRPRHVFLPFFMDGHLDHRLTNQIFLEASEGALEPGTDIWGYEAWSPCAATVAVDISAEAEAKARAIGFHASQDTQMHYADSILGLNRFRAMQVNWHANPALTHAEAFARMPLEEYRKMASEWFARSAPPRPR